MIEIDMKMPSCCEECFALDDHSDYPYCLISHDQRGYTFNTLANRMPSCPLKSKEPRVLTLEEVMRYIGYSEKTPPREWAKLPLWTESRNGTGVISGYRDVENLRNLINMSGLDETYIAYKHWRCWSSRPTDEQREATPWEK